MTMILNERIAFSAIQHIGIATKQFFIKSNYYSKNIKYFKIKKIIIFFKLIFMIFSKNCLQVRIQYINFYKKYILIIKLKKKN